MASWTNIADALIALKKPITYVIGRQLRDNPIAIAEGAVGAPRVVVPTALSTAETDPSKVLGANGSGGLSFRNAASPVSQLNGHREAPQASAQPVIGSLPAGRHYLRLYTVRTNLAGTSFIGGSFVDVILNTTGTPTFEFAAGSIYTSGTIPVANVATVAIIAGGGGGTTATVTFTATSTGVTATWTNDTNYIWVYAQGLKAN